MITIIGTGHVFDLSNALHAIFDEKQPNLICVELDHQRYQALLMKQHDPKHYQQAIKNTPLIYRSLAKFQENMANEYGVIAGSEMLAAITYAQNQQIPFELIDMNAQQLFSHMWKTMHVFEKFKLFIVGFTSMFISKKTMEKELDHMQQNFDIYLQEIGKRFPTIKKALIDDRDIYMTDKLTKLSETYTNIVACVGDGHIPGISTLLQSKNIPYEAIRLIDIKDKPSAPVDTSHASFTTRYNQNL